jgi:hypothetical protein
MSGDDSTGVELSNEDTRALRRPSPHIQVIYLWMNITLPGVNLRLGIMIRYLTSKLVMDLKDPLMAEYQHRKCKKATHDVDSFLQF